MSPLLNIPNTLTFSRILAIPFCLYFYVQEFYLVCALIVILISLTDLFDGILARKLNQCTPFGALLDPVADKLFEMSFMVTFLILDQLNIYYVTFFLIRNLAQLSTIPVLIWWLRIPFKVEPKLPAKWASAMSMILICSIIVYQLTQWEFASIISSLSLILSFLLEIYMVFTFLPRYYQVLQKKHDTFN